MYFLGVMVASILGCLMCWLLRHQLDQKTPLPEIYRTAFWTKLGLVPTIAGFGILILLTGLPDSFYSGFALGTTGGAWIILEWYLTDGRLRNRERGGWEEY